MPTKFCLAAGGQWEESEIVNTSQGFYSLTGLQPGTEYHLVVMHGNYTQWESASWTLGPGIQVALYQQCLHENASM